MGEKFQWTIIEPLFHGFQYLTEHDKIYYHIEYSRGGYQKSPENNWVSNYKKDIKFRGKKPWEYKQDAIRRFADLIIKSPFGPNRLLVAGPPSKRRDSFLFDSRNEDVLKIVNRVTGTPISFNLEAIQDFVPIHFQDGYRSPENLRGRYFFTPFENVPDVVYIVDDVITSGSHFVVWKELIHDVHPELEVRGIYLARAVKE